MRVLARLLTLTVLFLLALPSCEEGDSVLVDPDGGGDTVVDIVPPYMPPDPSTYVCDPFEESTAGDRNQGLVASLFYTLPGEANYTKAVDYINHAHPVSDVSLFFNQLNIPTRPFDRGFITRSGEVISTPQGNTLYEYFGINFRSFLTLEESDPEGLYQLAVLSDDGAVLRMKDSAGNWQTIVDNDGTHPTRMGCAAAPVDMRHNSYVPLELDYYQGPRYHISLVVMWRPWNGSADDPSCGKQGNGMFFNSQVDPPAPQAAYNALLSRGWKVVSTPHYRLEAPNQNPCNEPAPHVEDYVVSNVTSTGVTASWLTDIAAIGRLHVTEVGTGATTIYTKKGFAVRHTMTVNNLTPNTLYRVKSSSESGSGLATETDYVEFRTLR
ncbi:MAG: hypothetical protein IPK68_01800 [Bdellovibrionales bacterium]|nr:hypothetical protein [Bdellovibrionales bacterium]